LRLDGAVRGDWNTGLTSWICAKMEKTPCGARRSRVSDGEEEREEREKQREAERKRDLEDRIDRSWMEEGKPEREDS